MLADLLSPIYLDTPALLAYSIITLAIIILIEATVLRLIRWASWKACFVHASVINVTTSLIGTCFLLFATEGKWVYEIPPPVIFIGAFALTVIVEGVELKVLKLSAGFSRAITNSLVANIFSYIFIGAMIYVALYPPVIGYRGRTGPYRRPTPPVFSPSPSPSTN
jgi:hypothetical protein